MEETYGEVTGTRWLHVKKKAAKADGNYKTFSIFPSCVFLFKFNQTVKMSFLKAVQQKQSTIGNNFSLFIGIVTVEGHSSLVVWFYFIIFFCHEVWDLVSSQCQCKA